MKKTLLVFSAVALLAVSCDGNTSNKSSASAEGTATQATTPAPASQGQQHTEYPDWQTNKGIGPVKTVQPPLATPPDAAMAARGEELFNQYCTACHRPKKRMIGPAMVGLDQVRTPEWLMNMILNPEEMIKKDPIGQALLEEMGSIMLDQNLTETQAREILEYIRTIK